VGWAGSPQTVEVSSSSKTQVVGHYAARASTIGDGQARRHSRPTRRSNCGQRLAIPEGLLHSGKVNIYRYRRRPPGDHSWMFCALESARGRMEAQANIRRYVRSDWLLHLSAFASPRRHYRRLDRARSSFIGTNKNTLLRLMPQRQARPFSQLPRMPNQVQECRLMVVRIDRYRRCCSAVGQR